MILYLLLSVILCGAFALAEQSTNVESVMPDPDVGLDMVSLISCSCIYMQNYEKSDQPQCKMLIYKHVLQVQIVQSRGYEIETYNATTSDGYILTMFRIPHGKDETMEKSAAAKPVCLLQHGLLDRFFACFTLRRLKVLFCLTLFNAIPSQRDDLWSTAHTRG
jgi:hypothetical protein